MNRLAATPTEHVQAHRAMMAAPCRHDHPADPALAIDGAAHCLGSGAKITPLPPIEGVTRAPNR